MTIFKFTEELSPLAAEFSSRDWMQLSQAKLWLGFLDNPGSRPFMLPVGGGHDREPPPYVVGYGPKTSSQNNWRSQQIMLLYSCGRGLTRRSLTFCSRGKLARAASRHPLLCAWGVQNRPVRSHPVAPSQTSVTSQSQTMPQKVTKQTKLNCHAQNRHQGESPSFPSLLSVQIPSNPPRDARFSRNFAPTSAGQSSQSNPVALSRTQSNQSHAVSIKIGMRLGPSFGRACCCAATLVLSSTR